MTSSPPPRGERLVQRLPADVRALRDVRASLRSWLAAHGAGAGDLDDIVLAASELLANAMAASPPRGPVEMAATWTDGQVAVAITNVATTNGASSNVERHFEVSAERAMPPVTQEPGRGLRLVRALTDQLDVLPGAGTTTVRFRRQLDLGGRQLTSASS